MEKRRMEHKQAQQSEADRKKIANKIVKMEYLDQPDTYFSWFEDIMIIVGIKREEWP